MTKAIVKQENSLAKLSDMREVAEVMEASGLFRASGWQTKEQIMTLMLLCQAENRDPISAMSRYDNIQGRVAKRSAAMLSDFLSAGGTVEWHTTTDKEAEATFTSPDGKNSIKMGYNIMQAKKARLVKPGSAWEKSCEDMLRWRCVSKALRLIFPQCTNLMQSAEEAKDEFYSELNRSKGDMFQEGDGQDLTEEKAQEVQGEIVEDIQPVENPVEKFLDLIKDKEAEAEVFLKQINYLKDDEYIADLLPEKMQTILAKPDGFMDKVKEIKIEKEEVKDGE